ncbi:MAG TPA: GNAT family N-acetyltransferase [Pseudogracilibacillus sp.]|nr:GNAT family N-acetyltransferase [Pseudogracilibacillus sp.]
MDVSNMHRIEKLTMHALPAKDQELHADFILRYTNGFTKRANSIYPMKTTSEGLLEAVKFAEDWYAKRDYPAVFKMTDQASLLELDNLLADRDYAKIDVTHVERLSYANYEPLKVELDVLVTEHFNQAWFDAVCSYNEVPDQDRPVFEALLKKIKARTAYASIYLDGQLVTCGLGVLEDGYFGLYDIVTAANYRNRGLAKQLVHYLLQWGQAQGAQFAYLQVLATNAPAIRVYRQLGFEKFYEYWYRVKDC